jgi:hypothetical protein
MSQSCFNFSLNENKRIAEDFGEIETQKLIELYFPDKNPASYNEFISNDKVKEALGLKGITEANKLLNTNYKKEISNQQLINLKSIISQTNNKLKGENKNIVYKLYNVKQLGESDNYTWGIREIKGNLDVDAKIERALTRGKTEQAKNLKNLNDNNQLTLFQLSNKQIIKPGVQELFDSNPELANAVYEAAGFSKEIPKRLVKSNRTLNKYIPINKLSFEQAQKEANTTSKDFNYNGFRWYESEDELFGGKDWRKDELPQKNEGTFEDDYYKLQVEFSQKARSFVIDKIKEFFKTQGWLESKDIGTGFFDSGREEDDLEQLIGFNDIVDEINKKEYEEAVRKNTRLSKLISWLEYNHPEDFEEMGFELLYDLPQDELFQAIRYWYKPLEGIEFTELADIYDPNSKYNQKYPEDIKSKDAEDLRKFIEKEIGVENKLYPSKEGITPQQKQQAQQLYSQYLDTIFPDSKVKDIVYRGAEKGIEKHRAYSHWTLRKAIAENFAKQGVNLNKKDESKNTVYFALLNIKNLIRSIEITDKEHKERGFDAAASFPNQQKPDGTYYENEEANESIQLIDKNLNNEITVFEPEQIHILGNKQDIEGFKEFVDKTPQQTLFQLQPEQTDSKEIIEQIDKNLNDYIKNNNINIEFKNQVLDSNGNDVVAFYDGVKKVIEINEGKRDSKTLPEELAHHLHLALGLDHTLVKRALNLISKVNYKKMLGQDYVQAYDNNDTLLKLELLGKLTAAAVRGETIPVELNNETGNKIWDTIKRMIDAVIRLFKPDTNIQKQLDNLSTEFANMLKSGTKVSSEPTIKTKLYQKNKNLIQLNSKVKPAYVYYTTLLTALKKRQKQFNPLSQEYKMIENQINTVDVALKELITNENELPLIKLVDETIIEVAQGINDFELNFAKGILPSEEELIKYISTLKSFSGFPGVETDVNKLKARLSNFIKSYLINKSSQVLGKEFTEEEVFAITNDVNVLEKNFGTLARTEFTLSRMLGLLIKQKQNTIERENKEAFENIQKATNKLKDWAASNGMTLEQTFDILQQEYRGTRILTKEYTSEFYKLINDTFKLDSEKGKQERAKIATYDDQNKKWIPKSTKYYNPNYQLIHKKGNEALLEYYNFFKKAVQNISDNVLPVELDDYFIPNVYEETLLDILKTQDSVGDKLKDSILHILEFNPFEKMGTIDNQLDVIYDADLIGDKIPLKYIQALPEDKKSKNLSAALLKFMYFANSYKHMSEILPIANLVEESITDPDAFKILQYGNPKLNVAAKSNIVEMVKTIKEMQILGKMRKEDEILNVLGFKMQYGKLIEFGLQYTSKIRLGLNPFAAVANIVIGNLGNIIEAAGGKYFTIGEYFNAVGTFHSESKKVDGLTNVFNPLMEMEDYENLKKLGVGSKEYREKINSLLYLPTRIGERQMQTSTMIAILKHQKIEVKDKNGKVVDKIPMWEAFDNEGKWDAKKMGYTISEQEINKITNRVHGVNQMIHGRYSAKDAAAIQQQALFRALMQFKKWIPAAVEQRFMAKRYDPLLGEETEGRYWAYAKGLRFMMAKLKNDIKKLEENKFTELDWYNMRRNAMELTMIGLLYGLSIFLKAGDDDDELKRNAGYKTYMRLLNSASGDMMQWYLPGTFFDKAMVIPATKTLRSIERTIQYTPYMFGDYSSDASGTYKTGERKDENKFWSNFFSLVPFGSSTSDMYRTWYKDDVSYVQRNR